MRCAKRLRLSSEERDTLLMAAGFAPEKEETAVRPPAKRWMACCPTLRTSTQIKLMAQLPRHGTPQVSDAPVSDGSIVDTAVLDAHVSSANDGPSDGESGLSDPPVSDAAVRKYGLLSAVLAGLLVILVGIAVVALPDLLAGPDLAMTVTPQSSTPLPSTATPIVSADGETLVLVSEFANYSPTKASTLPDASRRRLLMKLPRPS